MQVAAGKLSDVLPRCPHFDHLLALSIEKNAYLVGGAIRDVFFNRLVTDLDLIFPLDPTLLAKNFARQIGGHWFWLDRTRRQSRVVVNRDMKCFHYDFALFRAPDLEQDLLDRDFTINALALPLTESLSVADLVDPCCGLDDLQRCTLRMVGVDSFRNDPLRILKGVRHATVLGLSIESATLQAMQRNIADLGTVAPERVRQEVWATLAAEDAARGLRLLQSSGAGVWLFGDDFAGLLPLLVERLKHTRRRMQRLVHLNPAVGEWLSAEMEQGLSHETLLIWIVLSTLIDRKLPMAMAEKWRTSRKTRASVAAIMALDEATRHDFSAIAENERAYAWWAERCNLAPKLLLLALAVADSPDDDSILSELQDWIPRVSRLQGQKPADLVDGHWLINELRITEGPEMTMALELLRNAEISGQVSSAEGARRFLLQHYHNKD